MMARPEGEYALFKGENILAIGTRKEIAKKLNISKDTVDSYGSPKHLQRAKSDNVRVLVAINDDAEQEPSDCFAFTGNKKSPCATLSVKICSKDDCKFYKPRDNNRVVN